MHIRKLHIQGMNEHIITTAIRALKTISEVSELQQFDPGQTAQYFKQAQIIMIPKNCVNKTFNID